MKNKEHIKSTNDKYIFRSIRCGFCIPMSDGSHTSIQRMYVRSTSSSRSRSRSRLSLSSRFCRFFSPYYHSTFNPNTLRNKSKGSFFSSQREQDREIIHRIGNIEGLLAFRILYAQGLVDCILHPTCELENRSDILGQEIVESNVTSYQPVTEKQNRLIVSSVLSGPLPKKRNDGSLQSDLESQLIVYSQSSGTGKLSCGKRKRLTVSQGPSFLK